MVLRGRAPPPSLGGPSAGTPAGSRRPRARSASTWSPPVIRAVHRSCQATRA